MGESSIDRRLARLTAPKPRKRNAAKPLTEEQKAKNRAYWHETYKLRLVKLPACNQPLPEDPEERALFLILRRDAVVWRKRVMPHMPCDPADFYRGEA
jgi:hypothetical protein